MELTASDENNDLGIVGEDFLDVSFG